MSAIITGFFLNNKNTIIGIIIIGVLGFCGYFVNGLYNKIEEANNSKIKVEKEYKEKVTNLENVISDKNSIIALRDVTISLKDSNINNLKNNIELQNKEIEKYKVDTGALTKKIEELKNKPASVNYIKTKKDANCEEINKTIKTVKGLKYEDL